ncbi:MAG TPA: hypothetical protein VMR70_16570 [Flavisolibacter sp.]|nr:hypothetical protein [Flavisolibacter sp.]
MPLYNHHVEFFTATILRWQHLLTAETYKQIIIDSLAWLTHEDRCIVYGFVIMPNHIHLLWRMSNNHGRPEVQGALLRFTAHQFKRRLEEEGSRKLAPYFVAEKDRLFQFWQRDSLVKECWSEPFLLQKLTYIHNNPCQPHWNLAPLPEEYKWSSAHFYLKGQTEFDWLKHYAA